MLLNQIDLEGIVHGRVVDLRNNQSFEVFTKTLKNGNGWPKYNTLLKNEDSTIGYITFLDNPEQGISSFRGIEVISAYRGNNLSHAIFEVYFKICEQSGIQSFIAKTQKKPITTFLLMKYGFIPSNKSDLKRAFVYPSDNGRLKIGFNSDEYKKRFLGSRLANNNQYEIVDETEELPISIIQLSSGYRLENNEKYSERRRMNQDLFRVELF